MRIPLLLICIGLFSLSQAQDAAQLFAQAKDAVVTVETESGVGTGFVVGDGTLVVTAYHVVEGAKSISVVATAPAVRQISTAEQIRDLVGKLGGAMGEEAARKLGGLGREGVSALRNAAITGNEVIRSRAIAELIRALSDSDKLVRENAAEALGRLGDKRAVEPLIRALSDGYWLVRRYAANALGELGDTRGFEFLIRALSDSDKYVRSEVAEALGKLGDKRAVEPLRKLLNYPNVNVRKAARTALEKIGG